MAKEPVTAPEPQAVPPAAGPDVSAISAQVAQEAVAAERKRVADIAAVCNGEFNDIQAKAVQEGWDVAKTTEAVLKAMREARPTAAPTVIVKPHQDVTAKVLETAVALRCGISVEETGADEQTLELADKGRNLELKDICREAIRLSGGTPSYYGFDNSDIRAAFSTVSLPGILGNVANKVLLKSFNAVPLVAPRLCSEGNLNDFKESTRYRITDVGDLEAVAADGEIKDGGVVEEGAKNQLATYGKKFCLTRQMIINDDLGAFLKVPQAMGNRAARKIDQLFFARLQANPTQADGVALFHNTHKNLGSGALNKANLEALIKKFLDQTDADGQPISVEPRFLLVPTDKKFTAVELVRGASLVIAGSTDKVIPAYNALSDMSIEVISSPYLEGNPYYLFGNPAEVDTFEIGYLKGKKTPTIEQGDTDFNTLGMWFRVYFDIGVREQDHRGMAKSTGA